MNKKVIVITGGNSGLGYSCAENILKSSNDYHVVLACRNIEKGEKAKEQLIQQTQNHAITVCELDVSSLMSVHSFIDRLKKNGINHIYGLICNAGINGMNHGLTKDGYDILFETNHLGHVSLTQQLLPYMGEGRILVVSSDMHQPYHTEITWLGTEALAYPDQHLGLDSIRYSYSKLCNLYFTYELARKLKKQNKAITVNAFNPGLMIDTNFASSKARFTEEFLTEVADRIGSLEHSSKALCDLMVLPDFASCTGLYFDRSTKAIASSDLSYNEKNAKELWQKSMDYIHNFNI